MPSVSVAQQHFFGMLEHNPGMAKARGVNMTHRQMHDFAATSTKGLPRHKRKSKLAMIRAHASAHAKA